MSQPTIDDFREWFEQDMNHFADWETHVDVLSTSGSVEGEPQIAFNLYSDKNQYQFRVRSAGEGDPGYIGCVSQSRKPRAGESHRRGRDLADGPLTRDTWNRILAMIVSYELVKVFKPEPRRNSVYAS